MDYEITIFYKAIFHLILALGALPPTPAKGVGGVGECVSLKLVVITLDPPSSYHMGCISTLFRNWGPMWLRPLNQEDN